MAQPFDIIGALEFISAHYGKKFTPEQIKTWGYALKPYTKAQIQAGVMACLSSRTFATLPQPGEVVKCIRESMSQHLTDVPQLPAPEEKPDPEFRIKSRCAAWAAGNGKWRELRDGKITWQGLLDQFRTSQKVWASMTEDQRLDYLRQKGETEEADRIPERKELGGANNWIKMAIKEIRRNND